MTEKLPGTFRRRRKHRSRKKLKALLWTIGGVGVTIGIVMTAIALFLGNRNLLLCGLGYMACSCFALAAARLIAEHAHSRASQTLSGPGTTPAAEDGGMILVLLLAVIAVVSTIMVHVQANAGLALRMVRARSMAAELRIAAADAVWGRLNAQGGVLPAAGSTNRPATATRTRLPSGIETEVTVAAAPAIPAISLLADLPKAGSLYLVQSVASREKMKKQISCFVHGGTDGRLRIAGWLER